LSDREIILILNNLYYFPLWYFKLKYRAFLYVYTYISYMNRMNPCNGWSQYNKAHNQYLVIGLSKFGSQWENPRILWSDLKALIKRRCLWQWCEINMSCKTYWIGQFHYLCSLYSYMCIVYMHTYIFVVMIDL